MIRFLCTTCNKVKRVRHRPNNLTDDKPRVGICRSHTRGLIPRKVLNSRVKSMAHLGSTRKISASQQKSRSKK